MKRAAMLSIFVLLTHRDILETKPKSLKSILKQLKKSQVPEKPNELNP